MKLRTVLMLAAVCLFLFGGTCTGYAAGVEVTVNCDAKKNNSINAVLATLNKQGPNTIHVSGTCNESVIIDGFNDLTLLANPGASINDPTPSTTDDNDPLDISNSRVVSVQGFTINGGYLGISCFGFSSCSLRNNTIQGAADSAVYIGRQSAAELFSDTLQNSNFGLTVIHGAEAVLYGTTIQANQDSGAHVSSHSFLRISNANRGFGFNTIQGNLVAGVWAEFNSTVFVEPNAVNITANLGPGFILFGASVLNVQGLGNSITNNQEGVDVGDSSFANISPSTAMIGNTNGDVQCSGQFSDATGKFPCHTP